jgi:hypothetical protein
MRKACLIFIEEEAKQLQEQLNCCEQQAVRHSHKNPSPPPKAYSRARMLLPPLFAISQS